MVKMRSALYAALLLFPRPPAQCVCAQTIGSDAAASPIGAVPAVVSPSDSRLAAAGPGLTLPGGFPGVADPAAHVRHLKELLELERKAEVAQSKRELEAPVHVREALGTSVGGLKFERVWGRPGRLPVAVLSKPEAAEPVPFHALAAGDLVALTGLDGIRAEGTVLRVQGRTLEIALQDRQSLSAGEWRVDRAGSDVTYRRAKAALEELERTTDPRVLRLRDVLLGRKAAELGPIPEIHFVNPALNEFQRDAVRKALAARDVAVIHGPPGTGKTTTLAEVILQAARRGESALATAPSNVAVDNILERLIDSGLRVVRLGHPARTAESLHRANLDELAAGQPEAKNLRRLHDRIAKLARRGSPSSAEISALRAEARALEQEVRERILAGADVVLATHAGASGRLRAKPFDLAVMDEASQATEPLSWIPLLQARRAVFAGDPMQLPPTILSEEAKSRGLGKTLMERLMPLLPESLRSLLRVQYRMHPDIMEFPSREFYEGKLIAHESVQSRAAKDLEGVAETGLTRSPLQFIDTKGAGFAEDFDALTQSRRNGGEAGLTARVLKELKDSGLKPWQIGVITPYAAQARLVQELVGRDGPEVRTVDGFQGREKEVIVVSLVRSNPGREVGFLEDLRRLNVGLTRARRSLIVIGDSRTLSRDPLYRRFIEYAEGKKAVRSAFEWPE